jgi:arylformamidase
VWILLSHVLEFDTPAAGGRRALSIEADESVERGDPGTTFRFTAWNHAGSHADAPAHMVIGGARIADLPLEAFVFDRPLLLDVPRGPSELVGSAELAPHRRSIARCDLLLLRTGSGSRRAADPRGYVGENPGISTDGAAYLARAEFASLRAVGIDAVSIAATRHLEDGIEAHRVLFRKPCRHPFLVFEDLRLDGCPARPRRVLALPWLVRGLDSAQVTVVAER